MQILSSLSGLQFSAASAGYAPTNSADVSAIASAYATGKQDTLTFGYDDSAISSINGSALAGGGVTGDYVEKSAMEVTIGSDNTVSDTAFAQGSSNSSTFTAFAQGIGNTAKNNSFAQGYYNSARLTAFAQGSGNRADSESFALGTKNTAIYASIAQGSGNKADSRAFAQGRNNSAQGDSFAQGRGNTALHTAFAQGYYNSATYNAAVFGQYNLRGDGDTATGNSAAFAIGDGTASGARHDLMLVTKDGEITMYSSTSDTAGTGIMSSIRAISAAATGGGVDSATVSAIASSYAESAASGKLDSSAVRTEEWMAVQMVTSISGFQISAVTAAAATYADSAYGWYGASSKLDESATADFYPSDNPSGFISGVDLSDYATTAYVDSSVSGKMDREEMSAYLPFSAISADENSAITSINGSSVGGGNEITATYRQVTYDPELEVSSTSTATGTATGFGVIDQVNAVAFDTASHAYTVKLNDNTALRIAASQLVAGTWQTGGKGNATYPYYWLSFSPSNNAFPASATTGYLSPCQWATGAGIMLSAGYFRGMLKANELFLSRESVLDASTTNSLQGWYIRAEGHNGRGAHIGFTATNRSGGQYTGTGTTAFYTATADINTQGVSFSHTRLDSAGRASITTGGFTASSNNYTASSTAYMGLNRASLLFSANDTSDTGTGSSQAYYGLSGITFYDSASTSTIEPSSIGYWNDKLDSSAIECDADSAITAIGGSAIGGGGGVDEATVSAIASAYQVVSSVGDDGTYITSINGSALSGVGGGGGVTGDYVEKSATEVAIGSGNSVSATAFAWGENNSAYNEGVAFGVGNIVSANSFGLGSNCSAKNRSLALGSSVTAASNSLAVGNNTYGIDMSLAVGTSSTAKVESMVVGDRCSANNNSFAVGYLCSAYKNSFVQGQFLTASSAVAVFGKYNLHGDGNTATGDSAAFAIGDGTASDARHDLMLVTKDGEITMYSSTADTVGTGIMSSIRAISAAATGGGVDSATVSAIASAYAESAASSKMDSSAMTAYVEKTAYDNLYSAFTALSDVISTYSGLFSSISSKVDNSAIGVE